MKLRHIFAIARLELKRKRKTYTWKPVVFLLFLLALFGVAAHILVTIGVIQSNTFYVVSTNSEVGEQYFADSTFEVVRGASASLVESETDYVYSSSRKMRDYVSEHAFLQLLRERNYQRLDELAIYPKYLVYLNVSVLTQNITANVTVEDLLEELRPGSTTRGLDTEDSPADTPQEPDNAQPESDISSTSDEADAFIPLDSVGEQADVGFSDTQNSEGIDSESSEMESVENPVQSTGGDQGSTPPKTVQIVPRQQSDYADLQSPDSLNTFSFVQDLFIFVQILFVLNIASGLFGTAILQEKLNQRSSLLFLANVTKWEFILGKMLPYMCGVFLLFVFILIPRPIVLSHVSVYLIGFVLLLLYLGLSCLNGLLARNHKEFSFLSVFSVTGISLYLLIPAFMTNVSELSYASLLTPIALFSQGSVVNMSILAFVIPIYAAIGVLLLFMCSRAWDYESLYAFVSPFQKFVLLLSESIRSILNGIVFGAGSVAFAWLFQLFLVAFIFSVEFAGRFVLFFLVSGIIEEFARNLAAYALFRYKPSFLDGKRAIYFSLMVGLGFMLAEKGFLILSIAPYLQGFELLVLSGLIAPFLLHSALTYVYIYLAKKSSFLAKHYFLTVLLLGLLHGAFNMVVLHVTGVSIGGGIQ